MYGLYIANERRPYAMQLKLLSYAELTRALGRELAFDGVDQNGWTDLHYAAAMNLAAAATKLVRQGADANAPLKDDGGQLDGAVVNILSAAGFKFKTWEREADTPLQMAAWSDAPSTVEALLGLGADVRRKNALGQTALHVAARFGRLDTARTLLNHGANVNDRDKHGWTPLHTAVRNDTRAVMELLLDNGARIDAKAERGFTPLHFAVMGDAPNLSDTPKSARVLLERGANVNAVTTDEYGVTPLDLAIVLDLPVTASVLRRYGGDVTLEEKHQVVAVLKKPSGPGHGVMMPVVRRTTKRRKPRRRKGKRA